MLIYVGVILSTSTRSYLYFFLFFLNFMDINFSQEYSLGCACISIKRIHKKVSGRMSESGFFLSQSHRVLVGIRDFQAKSGESRRDRDGWIVLQHARCFTVWGHIMADVTSCENALCTQMPDDIAQHRYLIDIQRAGLVHTMMISHYILYIYHCMQCQQCQYSMTSQLKLLS